VKNMGKYQAWDGGQFAVAAPSGTMVAQNVVSGIAPDDMTVVMARGEVELAPLPIANWDQHVPVLVRLVVYKRLPSQPVLVQTGDPFDTTTQNGLNDGEQATPGPQEPSSSRLTRSRHRRHRRRGGSSWSLGPRGASARETSSRSSWLLRARKASR